MHKLKLISKGVLSSLVGESFLDLDKACRILSFRDRAERTVKVIDPKYKAIL
jgi:acyl-homoserine lactone acylase PvdQ